MNYDLHVRLAQETPRQDIDAPYFYSGEKEERLPTYQPDGMPLIDQSGEQITVLFAPTHIFGLYHQSVNVIFVVLQGGKQYIVSSQRSSGIFPFPGAYSVSVGGHIKQGESALENAVKETREELGLEIEQSRLIPIGDSRVGHRLFAKNWEYFPVGQTEPVQITQFDPAGQDLIISAGSFPNQPQILDYIRSTADSPLIDRAATPKGLLLRNFNREYGFYYVVCLSDKEYERRQINPEEVKAAELIPWQRFLPFISDLQKTADAFYTLTRDAVLRKSFINKVKELDDLKI